MSKKTILSIILVIVGVIIGLMVISAYTMSGGKASITLAFMVVAILCIITGSILAFSRLLDRYVSPIIDEIHNDIEDDIQDIKEFRITNSIWMVIIIGIGLLTFSFFVFRFHKIEAMWGSIPVVIPTFIGMLALAWYIPTTRWFRESRIYTPMWIFLIPTIGFIITLWVGLAKTENLSLIRTSNQESSDYNSYRFTGFILQEASNVGGSGFELDLPDCDGDGCGVLLVIGLIILVFVLIIGSAMIPHFRLLSGSILLGTMVLIAIHDLRLRRSLSPPLRKLSDLSAGKESGTLEVNKLPDSTSEIESNSEDSNQPPVSADKPELKARDWFIYPESSDEKEINPED